MITRIFCIDRANREIFLRTADKPCYGGQVGVPRGIYRFQRKGQCHPGSAVLPDLDFFLLKIQASLGCPPDKRTFVFLFAGLASLREIFFKDAKHAKIFYRTLPYWLLISRGMLLDNFQRLSSKPMMVFMVMTVPGFGL